MFRLGVRLVDQELLYETGLKDPAVFRVVDDRLAVLAVVHDLMDDVRTRLTFLHSPDVVAVERFAQRPMQVDFWDVTELMRSLLLELPAQLLDLLLQRLGFSRARVVDLLDLEVAVLVESLPLLLQLLRVRVL